MEGPIKLPHPELEAIVDSLKQRVTDSWTTRVGGREFTYQVYEPEAGLLGLEGCYDKAGQVLVSRELMELDGRMADLVAWHEFVEIETERRGQPHARAHRRALVEELFAASQWASGHIWTGGMAVIRQARCRPLMRSSRY